MMRVNRQSHIRIGRLKPGSMLEDGSIIDINGTRWDQGPCIVPSDLGASIRNILARMKLVEDAGWRVVYTWTVPPGTIAIARGRSLLRQGHVWLGYT